MDAKSTVKAPSPPASAAPSPVPAEAFLFGIGKGEADTHTHVSFTAPKKLIRASAHVVVDETTHAPLNFFALQVDFPSKTWAHGGLQDLASHDAERKRVVNWGGLVDRGGGSGDYDKEDDKDDIELIENGDAQSHLGAFDWKNGVVYEYVVERGKQVSFPAGDYQFFPSHKAVHVDHERKMWEWRFTVREIDKSEPAISATLYDLSDTFTSFMVWNETNQGHQLEHHTRWGEITYRTADAPTTDVTPKGWHRF